MNTNVLHVMERFVENSFIGSIQEVHSQNPNALRDRYEAPVKLDLVRIKNSKNRRFRRILVIFWVLF